MRAAGAEMGSYWVMLPAQALASIQAVQRERVMKLPRSDGQLTNGFQSIADILFDHGSVTNKPLRDMLHFIGKK